MGENGHRPGLVPERGACPAWCTDCGEPHLEGARLHQGVEYSFRCYHEWSSNPAGSKLMVRAEWLDKHPADRGGDPLELEQPRMTMRDEDEHFVVDIPPQQARLFAMAVLDFVDSITAAA